MTEEVTADSTVRTLINPLALEAFVNENRRAAHISADHIAQLLSALYRFKVRLVRRMQYASIEEPTQPGIVGATRQRLDEERAALATLNVHCFSRLNEALRHREVIAEFTRKSGLPVGSPERKQLDHLLGMADMVITSARTMLDEAKNVLASYAEAGRKLA